MANVEIRLDTRELQRIATGLNADVDTVLGILAHQVEGASKALAPVDTGALKNSIETKKVKMNEWRVQDGVEYGIYQELGTSRMAAQPFMVPAVEIVSGNLNDGRIWTRIFK